MVPFTGLLMNEANVPEKNEAGFLLTECIAATAIVLVVTFAVYGTLISANRQQQGIGQLLMPLELEIAQAQVSLGDTAVSSQNNTTSVTSRSGIWFIELSATQQSYAISAVALPEVQSK